MNKDLSSLIELMPPPKKAPDSKVDFAKVEKKLGIEYPPDFKEFVSVYGSSKWCDMIVPVYPRSHSNKDIDEFKQRMQLVFSDYLEGNMYDQDFDEIEYPYYPEENGLLWFAADFSRGRHFWLMEGEPSKWPIVCWRGGDTVVVKKMNMTQMFLGWLQRKPRMKDLWGDLGELPKERITLG